MWYVVAESKDAEPEDEVWTISRNPKIPAWKTDGGCSGYGLTKVEAEEIVRCANLGWKMLNA